MSMDDASILAPLRAHAERDPERLLFAFLDGEGRLAESYSYEGFLRRTADIAAHLHRYHHLAPGERVLLVYPPGLEMICAFFACVRLGLIPVPLYPPAGQGFAAALYKMNFIARDCGASAVLTERAYYWSLKLHRARTQIASLSFKTDPTSRLRWIVTADAESGAGEGPPEAHSEIAFLQYTSGSTHDPKGVMVTHGNILRNCESVIDHIPVGVSWLPQYHDMGLIGAYLFLALRGGTTYGLSPVDFIQRPLLWLEAMSRFRATISAAPNFAYGYCLRPEKVTEASLDGLDFSALRILMNGAEPVRGEVFRRFQERFEPFGLRPESFFSAYGLAEYTLAVSSRGRAVRTFDALGMTLGAVRPIASTAPDSQTTTLVSCGRPLGNTEVRIVELTGGEAEEVRLPRVAPPGRVGEVWIRGPSKCPGYWGRPELSREIFEARLAGEDPTEPPWLRTGDLGFLWEEELYVCGRTKDLIIQRGLNYYPQDIEAVVEEDPAVREGCVAAFGVENGGGERVVVVAELRRSKVLPDTETLSRRICGRLGIVVDTFAFIPARTIPKTSSGKIMRHKARARWKEGTLGVIAEIESAHLPEGESEILRDHEPEPDGAMDAATRGLLGGLSARHGVTGTEELTLGEVGLDSLAIVEFGLGLQRYLKDRGEDELAAAADIRWLQKIAISELFGLVRQLAAAAPQARLRFKQAFVALQREHQEMERDLMLRDARLAFDPSRLPLPDAGCGSGGGGILLTGGTGFFGPFLIRSLLEQCDDDLYVLVRARDVGHAKKRLRESLAFLEVHHDSVPIPDWERRVIPICGDLARPRLGVSDERWRFLADQAHTIYHNGAAVNYLTDYASMRGANVGSTNEVVRLAWSHRPKVVNHISSTFIFGWSTKATLFESDDNPKMELLDFGYSQSKWVSEQVVFDAMRQGLSARVFRPALITPSINGGGYNFDIAIRLLAFMLKHGIGTSAGNQVSFSPADLVANNVVAIAALPETIGKTFHVTRDHYASMSDITRILGERTGTRFAEYPLHDFVPIVIERCRKEDLLFPLLDFLVRSVDNITAMEFKRYCNRNYREARDRSPRGMEDPPLEEVVMGIVRFMRRHGIAEIAGEEPLPDHREEEVEDVRR